MNGIRQSDAEAVREFESLVFSVAKATAEADARPVEKIANNKNDGGGGGGDKDSEYGKDVDADNSDYESDSETPACDTTHVDDAKKELKRWYSLKKTAPFKSYLNKENNVVNLHNRVNVFRWWRENRETFPVISRVAALFLAMPMSNAGQERVFSFTKRMDHHLRQNLKLDQFNKLTCIGRNSEWLNGIHNVQVVD
jgi:hypothetical protein